MFCFMCKSYQSGGLCSNPESGRGYADYMGEACPRFNNKDHITMKEKLTLKHCPSCGRDLPPEDFGPRTNAKDGLQSNCKECRTAAQRRTRERRMKEREERIQSIIFDKKEPSQPVPDVPSVSPVPETERDTGKDKAFTQAEIEEAVSLASSKALILELNKRGWKGTLTYTTTVHLNCE